MANLTSNESSKKAFIDYCDQFSKVSINSNEYRPAFDYIKDTIQKNPDYKNDPEIFGSLIKAVSGYKFLDLASSKIKNTKQSMLKFIDETDRVFDAIEIVGRAETGLKRDAGFLFSAYDKVLQLAIKHKRPAWACEVFDKADTSLKKNENFIFNAFDKLAESVQLENVTNVFKYAGDNLKKDRDFLYAGYSKILEKATKENKPYLASEIFQFADKELLKDKDFVSKTYDLIIKDKDLFGSANRFLKTIDFELKNDYGFMSHYIDTVPNFDKKDIIECLGPNSFLLALENNKIEPNFEHANEYVKNDNNCLIAVYKRNHNALLDFPLNSERFGNDPELLLNLARVSGRKGAEFLINNIPTAYISGRYKYDGVIGSREFQNQLIDLYPSLIVNKLFADNFKSRKTIPGFMLGKLQNIKDDIYKLDSEVFALFANKDKLPEIFSSREFLLGLIDLSPNYIAEMVENNMVGKEFILDAIEKTPICFAFVANWRKDDDVILCTWKNDRDEVLQYSPNIIEEKIKDPNFLAKLFWIDNEYVLSLPSLQNSKTEFYNDFVNAISQTKEFKESDMQNIAQKLLREQETENDGLSLEETIDLIEKEQGEF